MISMASILHTINHIIQQANTVTVCQGHWKLIINTLNRFQTLLNEVNSKFDNCLTDGIIQILKAINRILDICNEQDNNLNRVTYKELESSLLQLNIRLVHYEINIIDDYELKVQILMQVKNLISLMGLELLKNVILEKL